MKAYVKKLSGHDITHEISISSDVAITFFDGLHDDSNPVIIKGYIHKESAKIKVVKNTDYRLGGEINKLIASEAEDKPNAGDFMVVRKNSSKNYSLELVKPNNKAQYDLYSNIYSQMGSDKHILIELDERSLMKDRFEAYLTEIRRIGKQNEQINCIEKWSQKAREQSLIDSDVFDIEDVDEYRRVKDLIFANKEYIAHKTARKNQNPTSGLIDDQALNNYEDFLVYLKSLDDIKGRNILLYGVPGSGKSTFVKTHFPTDVAHRRRVVFHPDYTFADFVGQLLPKVDKDDSERIRYEFVPGPFTDILKRAIQAKDKSETFYLIIEEINRGNAPAIFGDLFQLLDRNDSGESEYGIINYDIARELFDSESDDDNEIKNKEIKIPSNLWIIATMNTSDQNVFTLDTAFQRRWEMKSIPNNIEEPPYKDKLIEHTTIHWSDFVFVINKTIEESESFSGFGDKRLGAFFAKERELSLDLFPGKVLKYLWDDAFKMSHSELFKDFPSLEKMIDTYENAPLGTDSLKQVLKDSVYKDMKDGRNASNQSVIIEEEDMASTQNEESSSPVNSTSVSNDENTDSSDETIDNAYDADEQDQDE